MIATFNKILLAFLDISDKQNYCCVSDSFKKDVISSPSNKKVAKLTIKKPELCHWLNFEHILHLFSSVSGVGFDNVNVFHENTRFSGD